MTPNKFLNTTLLILFILSGDYFAFGQNTIPNAGFENWTNITFPVSYEEPDDWYTPNQGTSLSGIFTVTKTTDAHSGNYAIRLETKNVIIETIPGTAIAGAINPLTLEIDPGFDIPSNPLTLTGWYKYQPFLIDAGSIEVLLSKWNSSLGIREPIGTGIFVQPLAISTYTQFTIDIFYSSTDTADTAIITLLSGSYTQPPGSVLFVDDLSFTFPPPAVGIEDNYEGKEVFVYPNPVSSTLHVSTSRTDIAQLEIRDLSGRLVQLTSILEQDYQIDVRGIANGAYIYMLLNKEGKLIQRGKLVVN